MSERFPQPVAARRIARSRLLSIATFAAAATTLVTGCYHLVMPVDPPRIPDEFATLQIQPRRTVQLINGYTGMTAVWFRSEGIHHIGADLREWTDRLLTQLQLELEPRGVSALIVRDDQARDASGAALRVWITGIVPPFMSRREDSGDGADPGAPLLEARIESEDGEYQAEFSSGATSHGFSDALYHLKESILVDGNLAEWFRQSPTDA